jgi:cellulose synthase operon protein C
MNKQIRYLDRYRLLFALPVVLLAGCGSPEQRSQSYYERGMDLIAKKEDVKARGELLNAVKYKGDKIEAWRALAGVDERTKAGQALFQDLRRVVELDPKDLDARIKLARIMVDGGATDGAAKVIEAANEGDKPNAALHALKALIFLRTKDSSGAVREAQRALEIDPANIDALLIVAAKKISDGDADGALKMLSSTPVDAKDEYRVSLEKMQAFAKKGDLVQTEALLQKLIVINPQEPAFRTQLVQILIAQKRFDDAEKELRIAADAKPANTKATLDLVRFLISVKGANAGRDELASRIKAGGEVFDYEVALAELEFSQGNLDDAVKRLQRLANTASSPERKITAQNKLAEIYVNKVNFAAAGPLIEEVLQKDRRNTTALRLRATIRIEQGQFDNAIADLREALNDQPKSPELLLLMAAAYERSGKNELADRQYADALKVSGQNPAIALRYAAFLQRRGDNKHAEDMLADVAGTHPTLDVVTALAKLRLAQKNWTGALALADALGKSKNGEVAADQIRAAAFAGQNKVEQSVAALEDAHKASPDAVQPVVLLATAYVKTGKPEKADALLQAIHQKFPNNAEVLVLMGQTKAAQKKDDEAVQDFKAAIEQQPKDPNGYSALTEFFANRKNYDQAIEVLQSGLKQQPTNINFRLSSAGLEILKGDQPAAIAQYQAILKDQPNSLVAINNLVSLILDYRTDKESLGRAYDLANALKGSNVPQFQDTYGWALYKQGDYKNALLSLEAAQVNMTNSAPLHYHLGMTYAATGQADKASEQFKAAFAIEPDGTPLKENIRSALK